MSGNYHAAAEWDYVTEADDGALDHDDRLPLGWAVLSIAGMAALLWAAILAPLSLI